MLASWLAVVVHDYAYVHNEGCDRDSVLIVRVKQIYNGTLNAG